MNMFDYFLAKKSEQSKDVPGAVNNVMEDMDALGLPKESLLANKEPIQAGLGSPAIYKQNLDKYKAMSEPLVDNVAPEIEPEKIDSITKPKEISQEIQQDGDRQSYQDLISAQRNRGDSDVAAMIAAAGEKIGRSMAGGKLTQLKPDLTQVGLLQKAGESQYQDALNREKLKQALELKRKTAVSPFAKEDAKEQRDIHKENRKLRQELDKGEIAAENAVKQIKDATAQYEKFQKDSITGTGPVASAWGLRSKLPFQSNFNDVDSTFKTLSLKSLVEMFAGMSKAIDTGAERAAFEATQPSTQLPPSTNRMILKNKLEAAEKLLAKTRAAKSMYDRKGEFVTDEQTDELRRTAASPTPTVSDQDKQAKQWAEQNPNDPRAKQIMNMLKSKGF
jgi:hypothetical protein